MAKNIVICCDGTANQFGKNNTNAKIHISVREKMEKSDYKPKNLLRAIKNGVTWVD